MADALQLAYAHLNRRERTVAEVRARLEKAECAEGEVDAAITELLELGYLDDARYARLYVEDRRNLDGWGRERIARNLTDRGIERETVAAALGAEAGGSVDELARARELLEQRAAGGPGEDPRERERAFGMLIRKGYGSEVAADAIRAWSRG